MADSEFIVFGRPDLHPEDIAEVVDTLESGWIGTGPKVALLEQRFARYVEAPYAVATSSCTAAMHLALLGLGVGRGDEVVVPTMTFPATASVAVHVGATPVFCDVDPATRTIAAADLEGAMSERTTAVIPVHFAGYPADLAGLRGAIGDHPVRIVVDAAHGIETRSGDAGVGALNDISAFSFYATKNVTTAEGGMLTTADEHFAAMISRLRLHGLSADAWNRYGVDVPRPYVAVAPGWKYNLSDLQAALAINQLDRIERSLKRRGDIWAQYDEAFSDLPIELPPLPDPAAGRSALHLYSPLLDIDVVPFTRDEFRGKLHARGIGTGIHFIAVHLHPFYRERYGLERGMFPVAERISDRTVSLPMGPGLTDGEVDRVIDAVSAVLAPFA